MKEVIGYIDDIGNGLSNMGITDEIITRCRDCENKDKLRPGLDKPCGYDPDGFCKWAKRRES